MAYVADRKLEHKVVDSERNINMKCTEKEAYEYLHFKNNFKKMVGVLEVHDRCNGRSIYLLDRSEALREVHSLNCSLIEENVRIKKEIAPLHGKIQGLELKLEEQEELTEYWKNKKKWFWQ